MSDRNKQKLMATRGGTIAKPLPRSRKGGGKSGGSHFVPVEDRKKKDRTKWVNSIRELFR